MATAGFWGFADHEHPTGLQQGSGALGGRRRGTEAPGRHRCRPSAERTTTHHLCSVLDDRHLGQRDARHGLAQERRPLRHRFDQHDLQIGPGRGDHEAGDTTSAPEVDELTGDAGELCEEGLGVVDVGLDGSGSEEPQVAGSVQLVAQV